jgi:two-component system, OmpR family, sensor kinase
MTRVLSWFDSIVARTIVVLLIGIGLVHVASLWTYQLALQQEVISANDARLADRLISLKRAVMRAGVADREAVAHDLSGGPFEAHWSESEHAVAGGPGSHALHGLEERLRDLAPDIAEGGIIIGANRERPDDPHIALISMQLQDRSWINVSVINPAAEAAGSHGTLLSTSLMALGAVLVSIVLVRWLAQPLSTFADAARRLYHGNETVIVPERGPREVRALAVAFNEMQRRIGRLIEDRTQALAAVSHDLKTPITRLRFRAEDIVDPEARAAVAADLDDMERMIDQTLTYLRGENPSEPRQPVDIAAILTTIANAEADLGAEVALDVPRSAVIEGHHLALKRAFENIIGNAIKYGERASIRLIEHERVFDVAIADDGPGIAVDQREVVFEPFRRLEASRNNETGGFGLGLAIARRVIDQHAGTIKLGGNAPKGLLVTISLPKVRDAAFAEA